MEVSVLLSFGLYLCCCLMHGDSNVFFMRIVLKVTEGNMGKVGAIKLATCNSIYLFI